MRNKEQHEGKGKEWACNNHNMRNPSLRMHLFYGVTHVTIVTKVYLTSPGPSNFGNNF